MVERKMVNNCCVVGCNNSVGKKKGLSFIVFPLVTKISVRNGYQLYVDKIGYRNHIPESAVSISSQVANLLLTMT